MKKYLIYLTIGMLGIAMSCNKQEDDPLDSRDNLIGTYSGVSHYFDRADFPDGSPGQYEHYDTSNVVITISKVGAEEIEVRMVYDPSDVLTSTTTPSGNTFLISGGDSEYTFTKNGVVSGNTLTMENEWFEPSNYNYYAIEEITAFK